MLLLDDIIAAQSEGGSQPRRRLLGQDEQWSSSLSLGIIKDALGNERLAPRMREDAGH